ncbi:MAG: hypothetical protein QOE83_2695 [Actinomycetota bacterium]|jgi:hypothetical protein|nr:hypothetical protein [Actinomycetota bacterium]
MEPRVKVPLRREIARKGGFILELVDDVYETRRQGTSRMLARFPNDEVGTAAAHDDLALRRRREWRRLLLPRVLGITALVSGVLWVAFSVIAEVAPGLLSGSESHANKRFISSISLSFGISQRIIRVSYCLLVFSSLSLIVVFLIRRLGAEETE